MTGDRSTPGSEHSEDQYTVGEHRINIQGDLGRPEVFVETSPEETLPSTRVTLLRDSNAVELYEKLGEYLREQGLIGDEDDDGHRFENCPDCGGRLEYPTQADVSCSDCDGLFTHEIRGDRHLLWRFSHEDGMEEVVARAE